MRPVFREWTGSSTTHVAALTWRRSPLCRFSGCRAYRDRTVLWKDRPFDLCKRHADNLEAALAP
jgi:hypothetical protein